MMILSLINSKKIFYKLENNLWRSHILTIFLSLNCLQSASELNSFAAKAAEEFGSDLFISGFLE
jgi:hypothetical protein